MTNKEIKQFLREDLKSTIFKVKLGLILTIFIRVSKLDTWRTIVLHSIQSKRLKYVSTSELLNEPFETRNKLTNADNST